MNNIKKIIREFVDPQYPNGDLETDIKTYEKKGPEIIRAAKKNKQKVKVVQGGQGSSGDSMAMGGNDEIAEGKEIINEPQTKETPEAIIEPQDKETIKYLSNVKDPNTGEISKPFTIGGKNYQMIRGMLPSRKIVPGVFCLDDLNSSGKNIIHPLDYFEKNIAIPAIEMIKKLNEPEEIIEPEIEPEIEIEPEKSNELDNDYSGSKHFFVDRNNGGVRHFPSIKDLVSTKKTDDEDYMNIQEFKRHLNEKLFGKRKRLSEQDPTGEVSDEQSDVKMNTKAQKLMTVIDKKIPDNVINTIKTPVAKREVIAAFAKLIGVERNQLAKLIAGLKNLANVEQQQGQQGQETEVQPEPLQEHRIITKNELSESLRIKKIIKVKDIKQ